MQGLRVVRFVLAFRRNISPLHKTIVQKLIFCGKPFASEKIGTKPVKKLTDDNLGRLQLAVLGGKYGEADKVYNEIREKDDKTFEIMFKRCKYELNTTLVNKIREDLNKSNVVPSFATVATAIETFSKLGLPKKIVPFIKEMQKRGFKVEEAIFQKLLSITQGEYSSVIMETISLIGESNIPITTKTYNLLLKVLGDVGKLDLLNKKVEEMNMKGINFDNETWNTLCLAYLKSGKLDDAENLLNQMKEKNVPVAPNTYTEFFYHFAKRGMTEKMRLYYAQLKKSEIVPSPQTFHILLHGFANAKDKEGVTFMLAEMRRSRLADAMAWNIAITAVAKAGDQLLVLEYLHEMLLRKMVPVLEQFAKLGNTSVLNSVNLLMDKFNLTKDHGTFATLIRGFGKPETFEECWKYYTRMKAKEVTPFASDIEIVVQACPSYKSEVFSELLKDGIQLGSPDVLICLMDACFRFKVPDKALELLEDSVGRIPVIYGTVKSLVEGFNTDTSLSEKAKELRTQLSLICGKYPKEDVVSEHDFRIFNDWILEIKKE